MTIDLQRLREDAADLLEHSAHDSQTSRVAHSFLLILDNPTLVIPEGWALVKKPELRGKGIATRGA